MIPCLVIACSSVAPDVFPSRYITEYGEAQQDLQSTFYTLMINRARVFPRPSIKEAAASTPDSPLSYACGAPHVVLSSTAFCSSGHQSGDGWTPTAATMAVSRADWKPFNSEKHPGTCLLLYVDDDNVNQRVLEMLLSFRQEFRVLLACDQQEVEQVLEAEQCLPDIVFMDNQLVDCTGVEVRRTGAIRFAMAWTGAKLVPLRSPMYRFTLFTQVGSCVADGEVQVAAPVVYLVGSRPLV